MNLPAEQFMQQYTSAYNEAGYAVIAGGPLYRNGETTAFASCTVSNYREALGGASIEAGSLMLQRCFRTRGLETLHTDISDTRRLLFDMYGGFQTVSSPDAGEQIREHWRISQSILIECGADTERICAMASEDNLARWGLREDDGIVGYDSSNVSLPTQAGKQVKQYGDGITGNGLEIFTKTPTNEWMLSGNIVETVSADGDTTGIDFGGGLEATVRALHGSSAAYLVQELYERFGLDASRNPSPQVINMLEAFEASIILLGHETTKHPLSATNHALSLAVRALSVQANKLGLDETALQKLGTTYHSDDLESPAFEQILAAVADRRSAITELVASVSKGSLRTRLNSRREQAVRQGHHLSQETTAQYILSLVAQLPETTRKSLPKDIVPEEILYVN